MRGSILTAAPLKIVGPRFVCVGFNKTGTTSIARCFEVLGLGPIAQPGTVNFNYVAFSNAIFEQGFFELALSTAAYFRSFKDRPWNIWDMYRRMDERFPGSFFILTERDSESWWDSVERWLRVSYRGDADRLKRYLQHLKVEHLNKAAFVSAYERYNDAVKSYFRGRDDLLVMNLQRGDGWAEICGFIGRPIPEQPFPHANQQGPVDGRPR